MSLIVQIYNDSEIPENNKMGYCFPKKQPIKISNTERGFLGISLAMVTFFFLKEILKGKGENSLLCTYSGKEKW